MDDSDAASLYKAQRGASAAPALTTPHLAPRALRRLAMVLLGGNAALKQEEAVIEAAIAA